MYKILLSKKQIKELIDLSGNCFGKDLYSFDGEKPPVFNCELKLNRTFSECKGFNGGCGCVEVVKKGKKIRKFCLKAKFIISCKIKYKKFRSNDKFFLNWLSIIACDTCLYCNLSILSKYIDNKDVLRNDLQIDHFFSQSKSPDMIINIFNFIPSCQICNSATSHKGEKQLSKDYYPYVDGTSQQDFDVKIKQRVSMNVFDCIYSEDIEKFAFEIQEIIDSSKSDSLNKVLHLQERYNNPAIKKFALEWLQLIYAYENDYYIDDLVSRFEHKITLSQSTVRGMIFNSLNVSRSDFPKMILSKLKYDLLMQHAPWMIK